MNEQDIFNKVAAHLLKQNKASMIIGAHSFPLCKYRSFDGLKCAIGCLIPDEDYDPAIDDGNGLEIGRALPYIGVKTRTEIGSYLPLLRKLQHIHDQHDPSTWAFQLAQLAADEGLTYTPPTNEETKNEDLPETDI
jgi:hypothetical protein